MSEDSLRSGVIAFCVRNDKGELDEELSLEKFMKAFAGYKAQSEIESGLIGSAIDRVFDTVAKRMNMAALRTFVLQDPSLKVSGQNFNAINEMLDRYVADNTDLNRKRDRKTKKITQHPEAVGTRKFHSQKGPSGGLFRNADFPDFGKTVAAEESDDDSE